MAVIDKQVSLAAGGNTQHTFQPTGGGQENEQGMSGGYLMHVKEEVRKTGNPTAKNIMINAIARGELSRNAVSDVLTVEDLEVLPND